MSVSNTSKTAEHDYDFNPESYDMSDEVTFQKNPNRKSLFPIVHEDLWNAYKRCESAFWTFEEADLTGDLSDWGKMTSEEQRFIEGVLGFFSNADVIVNENLAENFFREIDILESKCFYGFQIMMENIHTEVYSQLIETLITNTQRKDQLRNAFAKIPSIKKLLVWAQEWIKRTPEMEYVSNPILQEMDDQKEAHRLAIIWCRAKRLVAFACVEGVLFSGPFAGIFWLKKKGILKGLTFTNEKISVDEGEHRDYACLMYDAKITNKPPPQQIINIVEEAVELKKEYMASCLDRLQGINIDSMSEYIEFVADNLLQKIKINKRWGTANPFDFMDNISISGITNFFERKVGEYSMSGFEEDADKGAIKGVLSDF